MPDDIQRHLGKPKDERVTNLVLAALLHREAAVARVGDEAHGEFEVEVRVGPGFAGTPCILFVDRFGDDLAVFVFGGFEGFMGVLLVKAEDGIL